MRSAAAAVCVALAVATLAGQEAWAATDCVTHRHLEEIRARMRPLPAGPALFGGEKLVRDSHGSFPNQRDSANFSVKWGPDASYSDAQVDRMLEGFEEGWSTLVVEMGHPAPGGTQTYRHNVYIGNSGGNAPEIPDFAGGYATLDADGYPMIVMSPLVMDYFLDPEYAPYGDGTSVHELFHTVQFGSGAYALANQRSYWYWEATAEWAASQTFPGQPAGYGLIGGFALYPHLALDSYEYPDGGKLVELHQYGAMIFAQFVSEHAADWTVIRDSWSTAGAEDDPITVLRGLLADRGLDFGDVYARFAAHNATWDYAAGALYAQMVEYYADAYPDEDFRFAAEAPRGGTRGEVEAPEETLPEGYGYNVIRMAAPQRGALEVSVEADPTGSEGSPADFRATLVRAFADRVEYVPLTGGPHALRADVETGGETAIFLVVASQPATWESGESFAYRYALDHAGAGGDGDRPLLSCSVSRAGFGAAGGPIHATAPVLLLAGLFAIAATRRRR